MEVLKAKVEIKQARLKLRERGLSFTIPRWQRWARKITHSERINVGDELKSWDVLKTTDFLENSVSKNDPILDIGAFASELPSILYHLGYTNLSGVDLDPRIKAMPFADTVRYEVSDFLQTPFSDGSFRAITAISVIEHGFNAERLLKEISRLLRPNGFFIASFDYWPDKVDTQGVSFFGMDWKIFSTQEIEIFLHEATKYGFFPCAGVNFGGRDKAIRCANRDYTFAWLALQKSAHS